MSITDYLNTAAGIVWTSACIPLGILFSWLAVLIINRIPAKWLCDYGEEPSEELLSGKRVRFKKEGIIMAVLFCAGFVMCRLQFNRGFDIYFIVLSLIIFFSVMTAVCDIKYMIIPDQFTIAVGVLSAAVSIYDILRGFKILHFAWWTPLLGIAIGGGAMLIIDLIGMIAYKKEGMGFGDVKLFAAIGILTGLKGTICTFVLSLIAASVCFLIIIVSSKIKSRKNKSEDDVSAKSYLAFGPYISAALVCYIVLFDTINYLAGLYIELF